MFNLTFSGTEVLLGTGLLVLGLGVLYVTMKYYFNKKIKDTSQDSSRTKYASADVFQYQPTFFKVGLMTVLAFTLMAFNWTQFSVRALPDTAIWDDNFDLDNAPPITFHAPPPPPPPPPKPIIEVVPDELIKESKIFNSMDANVNDVLVPRSFVPKAPPPPPPPIPIEDPTTFRFVERMPVFGDCSGETSEELRRNCSNKALISFIGKGVKYPAIAKETGIDGTAVIRFVIEKDGSMSNLEIIRDPGGRLGEEALRVVELMANEHRWTAGKQQGRPVRVQFNLPVKFQLQ